MVDRQAAHDAYKQTRLFYKGQIKSANKSYYGTGPFDSEEIHLDNPEVLKSKQIDRNQNTLIASAGMTALRTLIEQNSNNAYEAGRYLVNSQTKSGNCGEMAVVAMYYGREVGIAADQIFLYTLRNENDGVRFAHSMAVFGDESTPGVARWIADVWSHIFCSQAAYPSLFQDKMRAWHAANKRLAAVKNGTIMWLYPTHPAIMGIVPTRGQPYTATSQTIGLFQAASVNVSGGPAQKPPPAAAAPPAALGRMGSYVSSFLFGA